MLTLPPLTFSTSLPADPDLTSLPNKAQPIVKAMLGRWAMSDQDLSNDLQMLRRAIAAFAVKALAHADAYTADMDLLDQYGVDTDDLGDLTDNAGRDADSHYDHALTMLQASLDDADMTASERADDLGVDGNPLTYMLSQLGC